MKPIAKFERVSYEEFEKSIRNTFPNMIENMELPTTEILKLYNLIELPKRATKCSAGYDFFVPVDIVTIKAGETILIPTGIKCRMDEGWVLQIYPRSGHGFKHGVHLANTVGIIDGDYYNNCSNEGHIFVKIVNDSSLATDIHLSKGEAFCQGVFVPFGITEDDKANEVRTGGIGSTSKEE